MIQAPGRLDSIVARSSCPWEFFSSLLDVTSLEVRRTEDIAPAFEVLKA